MISKGLSWKLISRQQKWNASNQHITNKCQDMMESLLEKGAASEESLFILLDHLIEVGGNLSYDPLHS